MEGVGVWRRGQEGATLAAEGRSRGEPRKLKQNSRCDDEIQGGFAVPELNGSS